MNFGWLLESVHNNLVQKIRPHIGVQEFASDKFEKILGAGHAQQETYIVKALVVRDPLRGFSQIRRMQNLNTNMWSYFSN